MREYTRTVMSEILRHGSRVSKGVESSIAHQTSSIPLSGANWHGIEATDVSSLLAQFEEASASLSGVPSEDEQQPCLQQNVQNTSTSNGLVPTPPPTPPVDGKNVRISTKRKSAIMIPMLVPAKRERGKAVELSWGNTSKKLQRIMQQQLNETEKDSEENAVDEVRSLTPPCSQEQSLDENMPSSSKDENIAVVIGQKPELSSTYFDSIPDHDYCQNFPTQVVDKSIHPEETDLNQVVHKNMTNQSTSAFQEDDNEFGYERYSKFSNERDYTCNTPETEKASFRDMENNKFTRQKRNYRKNDKKDDEPVFDKLPQYFTVLTKPKLVRKDKCGKVEINLDEEGKEREASPTRETLFDKLPAYYSCFTNSTKYDGSEMVSLSEETTAKGNDSEEDGEIHDTDASKGEKMNETEQKYPWDRLRDKNISAQSSRSQTPLIIDSRSGTPSLSRPQSRSRSRTNSPSKNRRSPIRSSRHRKSRSPRRRSYSSDSCSSSRSRSRSASSDKSRSRSSKKHSRRSQRTRSRATKSRSRSPSTSRSRSRSRASSRYRRSRSPLSRSRSRSRESTRRSRRYHHRHNRRSRSSSYEDWCARERERKKEQRDQEKKKQIEERRIIYVGKIPDNYTRRDLRRRFDRFGPIEQVGIHFREDNDNYGFVTFAYTCDAYAAIEKGNRIRGEPIFDLCFGGRREFCKNSYADLDGNKEVEEEFLPFNQPPVGGDLDFDSLLQQAKIAIKKNKK
ncbi:serine/arginine repetitive matrix protein 2 isoform X2 [Lingula anatina]|uniref:Serine/arginine repetitive matrix protein 2 isoform X2 n=1 Tax=Lingula anatina TaxID=7574 RepID=A0A1S3GXP1_LINAN|nr:serine/arginine repetitive matrix protein 2 isoform X2 [Lingula anatina]|eukprot:XP_013378630.1 serine/arginine repetitive matrix protein 2 isoform X2 [Lingula anatina]